MERNSAQTVNDLAACASKGQTPRDRGPEVAMAPRMCTTSFEPRLVLGLVGLHRSGHLVGP